MFAVGTLRQLIGSHIGRRIVAYLLVTALFIMGGAFGGMATRAVDDGAKVEIRETLGRFASGVDGSIPPAGEEVVRKTLFGDVLRTAALLWVLGLSVIGAPLILIITFFRGFALGFTAGFIVEELRWRGVLLAVTALVPHNLFAVAGLLVAGAAGLTFAAGAARILIGKRTEYTVYGQFASATLFAVVAAGLILAGAFVEAYITPVFVQLAARYLA